MERILETKEDFDDFIFRTPYFAFLDILGFKALVKNNDHNTLVELYQKLVTFPITFYNDFKANEQKRLEEKLGVKFISAGLRLVNISDSIVLWTNNSKEQSLIELLFAVKLLMSISMTFGIPLRGAVVKGDIEVLEQKGNISIIGKGLVHAYEIEKKQKWSGCMIDSGIFTFLKSFQRVILQKNTLPHIEKLNRLVVKFEVPLKDKKTVNSYVINWADNLKMTKEEIYDSFAKFKKRENEDKKLRKDIEEKIINTINFYKSVQLFNA